MINITFFLKEFMKDLILMEIIFTEMNLLIIIYLFPISLLIGSIVHMKL